LKKRPQLPIIFGSKLAAADIVTACEIAATDNLHALFSAPFIAAISGINSGFYSPESKRL